MPKIKYLERDMSDTTYLFNNVINNDVVRGGKSVLQVGARPGPGWGEIKNGFMGTLGYQKHDILEVFEPNFTALSKCNTGGKVILGDIRHIDNILNETYDIIIMWHGPEHLTKEEFTQTLPKIIDKTNIAVIVGCPAGIWEQDAIKNNPYEKHLYHYRPLELIEMGFDTYVFGEVDKHGVMFGVKYL